MGAAVQIGSSRTGAAAAAAAPDVENVQMSQGTTEVVPTAQEQSPSARAAAAIANCTTYELAVAAQKAQGPLSADDRNAIFSEYEHVSQDDDTEGTYILCYQDGDAGGYRQVVISLEQFQQYFESEEIDQDDFIVLGRWWGTKEIHYVQIYADDYGSDDDIETQSAMPPPPP